MLTNPVLNSTENTENISDKPEPLKRRRTSSTRISKFPFSKYEEYETNVLKINQLQQQNGIHSEAEIKLFKIETDEKPKTNRTNEHSTKNESENSFRKSLRMSKFPYSKYQEYNINVFNTNQLQHKKDNTTDQIDDLKNQTVEKININVFNTNEVTADQIDESKNDSAKKQKSSRVSKFPFSKYEEYNINVFNTIQLQQKKDITASDGINEFKNESVQKTKKNHVNNPTINMQTSPEEKGLEHHGFFPNEGWVDSGSSKNCKSEKDEQNSVGFNQINRSLGVVELIAIDDSDSDSDTSDNRFVQIFT